MEPYTFTLLIAGPDLQTDANLDALFEAGCDDATFGNRDRIQYADFNREAPNLAEAIRRRFLPLGGADELEPHPPVPVRDPPRFDR